MVKKAPVIKDGSDSIWTRFINLFKSIFAKTDESTRLIKEMSRVYDKMIDAISNKKSISIDDKFYTQLNILQKAYRQYLSAELLIVSKMAIDERGGKILTQVLPWQIGRMNWAAIYSGGTYKLITQYFNTDNNNSAAVKRLLDFVTTISSVLDQSFKEHIADSFTIAMDKNIKHLTDDLDNDTKQANFIVTIKTYPWIPLISAAAVDIDGKLSEEIGVIQ